jgi:hypothetical protein
MCSGFFEPRIFEPEGGLQLSRKMLQGEIKMAGIFPDSFGGPGGLFGNAFPQPQQAPGFGDMLNANSSNTILGYLAGALQGGNLGQSIGRGLQGWQQGQQQDQQRQIPGATWRALKAAGVPDATAQAAALNPDIMRAITPHYFQRLPSFGVIGMDEFGRRRYGFIDPFNRSIQPVQGPIEGQRPPQAPARAPAMSPSPER